MTQTSIRIMRCDRCGGEVEVREASADAGWGKFALRLLPINGGLPVAIGEAGGDDLCAACADALLAWWLRRDQDGDRVPTGHMDAIVARVAALLRQQVLDALAAARKQPTSVIGGDDPDAAFARIEERARIVGGEVLALVRRGGATRT